MMRKKEGFVGQRSCVLPHELMHQHAAHPLCERLYITDIGYYPNAAFHSRDRRKGSPQYILIYCVKGEGWYQLNDRYYSVRPNQAFILPANVAHRYGAVADNPWTIYWLHFMGSQAEEFLTFLQTDALSEPITVSPQPERFQLFDDILAHMELYVNMDNIIYANTSLPRFLLTFNNAVYKPGSLTETNDDPIGRTVTFMREHISQMLTLEELAQVAGMSASHYSALFRMKMQSAPISFFTFLKIQEACRLLENTRLRVKEVAYQTGYNDPYHFSRVFTNVMSVSPRAFRELRKR